jgi:hypothetical protein
MQPGCRGRAFACSPGRTREVDLMDLKGPPAHLSLGLRDSDSGPGSATRGGGAGPPEMGEASPQGARLPRSQPGHARERSQNRARQDRAEPGRARQGRGGEG